MMADGGWPARRLLRRRRVPADICVTRVERFYYCDRPPASGCVSVPQYRRCGFCPATSRNLASCWRSVTISSFVKLWTIHTTPQSTASKQYHLWHRTHDRQLPAHHGHLADCNFIARSHTRTVVRECFKGNEASQWKRPKFDLSPHQNPLTDLHKNWQAWLRPGRHPACKIL